MIDNVVMAGGDGKDLMQYMQTFQLNRTLKTTLPEVIEIDCTNVNSLNNFAVNFTNTDPKGIGFTTCKEVVLRNLQPGVSLSNFCDNNDIEKFTFVGGVRPSDMTAFALNSYLGKKAVISGEIDLSLLTSDIRRFTECVESFELKQNSLSKNAYTYYDIMSDGVLYQVANSLNESASSSIMVSSSDYLRFQTIIGTVSLDSTGTYHIFTQDASGDTTLADFITEVKGWTLASA